MKKIFFSAALMLAATCAMAQSHQIELLDTVYVGANTTVFSHETTENIWSALIPCETQAYPLFNEHMYMVFAPELPAGNYSIRADVDRESWVKISPAFPYYAETADSDGFGFIINENMPDEDLVTMMYYRDSSNELNIRYSGAIKTIRFVSSSSLITYSGINIDTVMVHEDSVTIRRVAVEGSSDLYRPNPTTDYINFGRVISFEVYDIRGSRLYEHTGLYFSFLDTNFPSGTYFIRNADAGTSQKVTFIRQ